MQPQSQREARMNSPDVCHGQRVFESAVRTAKMLANHWEPHDFTTVRRSNTHTSKTRCACHTEKAYPGHPPEYWSGARVNATLSQVIAFNPQLRYDRTMPGEPEKPQSSVFWIALGIPAILCILALADMPYGYYTFLRIVVFGSTLYGAYWLANAMSLLMWVFIAMAVLYNPIIRIHLDRETWEVWNIITAVFLVAGATRLMLPNKARSP